MPTRDQCLAVCFGISCSNIMSVYNQIRCEDIEAAYGCSCDNCDCPTSKLALPPSSTTQLADFETLSPTNSLSFKIDVRTYSSDTAAVSSFVIFSLAAAVVFVAVVFFFYLRKPCSRRKLTRVDGNSFKAMSLSSPAMTSLSTMKDSTESSSLPRVEVIEDVIEFTYV